MKNRNKRNLNRELRKKRIRARIQGTAKQPRLSVFRSNQYTYAQLIDDVNQKTIVSASTKTLKEKVAKTKLAEKLGEMIADKAKKEGIQTVVFDRGAYQYHGRVKAVAEAARKAGLKL